MITQRLLVSALSCRLGFSLALCGVLASCALPDRQPTVSLEAALDQAAQATDSASRSEAVSSLVAALQAQPTGTKTLTSPDGRRLEVIGAGGLLFDTLLPVPAGHERELNQVHRRTGEGLPLIARWKATPERRKSHPFLSEAGYLAPVTATLEQPDKKTTRLRLHDPKTNDSVRVKSGTEPLAADFSAVAEYFLEAAEKDKKLTMPGIGALRHSDRYMDRIGLISLEPVRPDRIPLVFVHGLMSRPLTWQNVFNDLGADPKLKQRYQMFFFRYPTGIPVVVSAARLRENLATLDAELRKCGNPHRDDLVLVGHSMGGLLSKMQVVSSGDTLWRDVFGSTPDAVGMSTFPRQALRPYLEWKANPNIRRVVFICTPHRGSNLAAGFMGFIAHRLINLPGQALGLPFQLLQSESGSSPAVHRFLAAGVPTSLDNLSPHLAS